MPEEHIREALAAHWKASASGNLDKEHAFYADDAICDYPQSGEGILGCRNMQPLPRHPGKPSGFGVKCTSSADDLWVTKQTITYEDWPSYAVSSVEFEDGGWSTRRGISPDCLPRRNGVATSSHRCIDPRPISGGRVTGCPSSEPSLHGSLAGSTSEAGAIEKAAMAATMHATAEASMAR
jgi:hypothetical protein